MRKKFLIMLVLAAVALFIVGCQGNVAGEAVKIGGVGKQAPAGSKTPVQEKGSYVSEEQLNQKLADFAKQVDAKSVSGAAFGGCPKGSTASICINAAEAYCMGSLEHGAQIIDCGDKRCSGLFPSGGCWGGDTQGSDEFQKEKHDSTAFGGCPMGSITSVCANENELLCIGSERFGAELIDCSSGSPDTKCTGNFPSAKCQYVG